MQKTRVHNIVEQLRRPLCALVVVCIVFVYCMSSYAAEGGESFVDRYGLSEVTIQDGLFAKSMYDRYAAEHDASVLSLYSNSQSFFAFNDVYRFMTSQLSNWNLNGGYYSNFVSQASSHVIPESIVDQSVTYSLSGCYVVMTSAENHWTYIVSDGYCCIIDGYIVSESPFHVFTNWRGYAHVTTASQNGLYVYTFDDGVNWEYLQFTDMDVFFKSSDGATGYTSFSVTDAGDFSFSDARSTYYNFNYLKTGGIIVAPGDPEPDPEFGGSWDSAYHYLNFRMSSDYYGKSVDAIYHGMKFNWNENMINNPGYYILYASYSAVYQDDTMSTPVTFTGPEVDLPLIVLAYRGNNQGKLPGSYMIGCPLSSFKDSNDNTLKSYLLQTIHRKTGTSIQYIDPDNFFEWFLNGAAFFDVTTDTSVPPLGYVVPEFGSDILKFEITGTVRIGRQASLTDSSTSDYFSGSNVTHFNFVSGDTTLSQSDNADNLYPMESGSNLPPSVISDGSGSNGISYGGSNNAYAQGGQGGMVIVNPEQVPYKMDMVDYGRMKDVFDSLAIKFHSEDENNGFLPVLEEFFGWMPPQFWEMLLIGFGVVTATATVRFVRNK